MNIYRVIILPGYKNCKELNDTLRSNPMSEVPDEVYTEKKKLDYVSTIITVEYCILRNFRL